MIAIGSAILPAYSPGQVVSLPRGLLGAGLSGAIMALPVSGMIPFMGPKVAGER